MKKLIALLLLAPVLAFAAQGGNNEGRGGGSQGGGHGHNASHDHGRGPTGAPDLGAPSAPDASQASPGSAPDRSQGSDRSDRSGFDAEVARVRQPGGYNNYCETWKANRERDQKLFGVCLD